MKPFSAIPAAMWVSLVAAGAIYLPCEIRAKTSSECDSRVASALAVLGIGGGAAAGSQLGYQRGYWTLNPKLRDETHVEAIAPRGLVEPDSEPASLDLELPASDLKPFPGEEQIAEAADVKPSAPTRRRRSKIASEAK